MIVNIILNPSYLSSCFLYFSFLHCCLGLDICKFFLLRLCNKFTCSFSTSRFRDCDWFLDWSDNAGNIRNISGKVFIIRNFLARSYSSYLNWLLYIYSFLCCGLFVKKTYIYINFPFILFLFLKSFYNIKLSTKVRNLVPSKYNSISL